MNDLESTSLFFWQDVSTMVCSIGIRLSEADLLEFVGRVVDLNNRELTEHCVTFPQFLATMTSIITVSDAFFLQKKNNGLTQLYKQEITQVDIHFDVVLLLQFQYFEASTWTRLFKLFWGFLTVNKA